MVQFVILVWGVTALDQLAYAVQYCLWITHSNPFSLLISSFCRVDLGIFVIFLSISKDLYQGMSVTFGHRVVFTSLSKRIWFCTLMLPGGTPRKIGWGVRSTSRNPYPVYDQNLRDSLLYLVPDHKFKTQYFMTCGRRGGLMVGALVSGVSGPGSSPGRGHWVVFLGKTLYSHSASIHPGV